MTQPAGRTASPTVGGQRILGVVGVLLAPPGVVLLCRVYRRAQMAAEHEYARQLRERSSAIERTAGGTTVTVGEVVFDFGPLGALEAERLANTLGHSELEIAVGGTRVLHRQPAVPITVTARA